MNRFALEMFISAFQMICRSFGDVCTTGADRSCIAHSYICCKRWFENKIWMFKHLHSGVLQETSPANRQGGWGEIWFGVQSGQGQQRGNVWYSNIPYYDSNSVSDESIYWVLWAPIRLLFNVCIDWGSEDQGGRPAGQVQETCAEESAHVCWSDASGSAGLQTQGFSGSEIQPQTSQEGGQRGGGGNMILWHYTYAENRYE